MTELLDVEGRPIPPAVKGREIWRVARPGRPGFRPETWILVELEDGVAQFTRMIRGRRVAVAPAVSFYEAGATAQAFAAGEIPPSPALCALFATALSAMHALAMEPDPEGGGEPAAGAHLSPAEKDAA